MRAPIAFPRTPGVNAFNDLTPRFGAAYDVFGNGKTAVKFNLGHYLSPATNDGRYTLNDPAATSKIVTSVDRNWSDTNGNKVVDCDILNFAAQSGGGGDTCGAITGNSLNFGKTGDTVARVNDAALHGWGVRPNDWQWGINLQQELIPRVSPSKSATTSAISGTASRALRGPSPTTCSLVRPTTTSGRSTRRSIRGCRAAAAIRLRPTR